MSEKKHRVLYVDNDLREATACERVLEGEEYTFETASSGEEAIEKGRDNPVSVVVFEKVFAQKDQGTPMEYLMKNCPETRRIVFTGWPERSAEWGRNQGLQAFCNYFQARYRKYAEERNMVTGAHCGTLRKVMRKW